MGLKLTLKAVNITRILSVDSEQIIYRLIMPYEGSDRLEAIKVKDLKENDYIAEIVFDENIRYRIYCVEKIRAGKQGH